MKILVTGATGFIGSHVADKLIANGHEVICIVRKSSDTKWLKNKKVELFYFDKKNDSENEKVFSNLDYIFHVAGSTFAKNFDEFLRGNRDYTRDLIEITDKYSKNLKRFLFVSSQTVAGPSKSFDLPVTENLAPNPITSYGKSKKLAEDEVLKYKGKIPFTIVRAPAVYGPRDTAILSVFQAANMGIGTLVGFNKKYISLIHSEDLSRGIIEAAFSENTKDEIYFVASERFYNWDELIEKMRIALGKSFVLKIKLPHFLVLTLAYISEFFGKFSKKPPVFNYEKGIDFIQDYWTCSIEKAKNDFNYKQTIDIDEGMKITVDWYKENKWL